MLNPLTWVGVPPKFFSYIGAKAVQLLQNPKLKFQNFESKMQNPKSRLGELRMKNGYVSIQNSKSKIRPNSLDLGFWIGKFSTMDFEIWVAPNKLGNSVPVAQSEARAALSLDWFFSLPHLSGKVCNS